jgi:hypothetical protein
MWELKTFYPECSYNYWQWAYWRNKFHLRTFQECNCELCNICHCQLISSIALHLNHFSTSHRVQGDSSTPAPPRPFKRTLFCKQHLSSSWLLTDCNPPASLFFSSSNWKPNQLAATAVSKEHSVSLIQYTVYHHHLSSFTANFINSKFTPPPVPLQVLRPFPSLSVASPFLRR